MAVSVSRDLSAAASPNVVVSPVPSLVESRTHRKETPAGTMRVVVNTVDGAPVEVLILLGRAGSELQSFAEAIGRLLTLCLRLRIDVSARERVRLMAEQIIGIGGAHQIGVGEDRVLSVVDAIGQVLARQGDGDPGWIETSAREECRRVDVPLFNGRVGHHDSPADPAARDVEVLGK